LAIKQIFKKRLLLFIQAWLSVLMKYGTGLTIALEVDEKSLDVESHLLMSVNRLKALHPATFYTIQLSELSPRQKDFLACLNLQVAKKIF